MNEDVYMFIELTWWRNGLCIAGIQITVFRVIVYLIGLYILALLIVSPARASQSGPIFGSDRSLTGQTPPTHVNLS